jgi:hypothetical protein
LYGTRALVTFLVFCGFASGTQSSTAGGSVILFHLVNFRWQMCVASMVLSWRLPNARSLSRRSGARLTSIPERYIWRVCNPLHSSCFLFLWQLCGAWLGLRARLTFVNHTLWYYADHQLGTQSGMYTQLEQKHIYIYIVCVFLPPSSSCPSSSTPSFPPLGA